MDPVDIEKAFDDRLHKLAEVGSSLCGYFNEGPEDWVTRRCDCKYLDLDLFNIADVMPGGEQTGCCEVRRAYAAVRANKAKALEAQTRLF